MPVLSHFCTFTLCFALAVSSAQGVFSPSLWLKYCPTFKAQHQSYLLCEVPLRASADPSVGCGRTEVLITSDHILTSEGLA